MFTIRLNVKDSAYERLLKVLDGFTKDEIEILHDSQNFSKNQEYLQNEFEEIEAGKAIFISQEEFESRLSKVVDKYEYNCIQD